MDEQRTTTDLIPRPYQLELVEYICERNGIIYLPTGAGKTFVAILALRRFSHTLQETISNGGKRAIFMCNTVELARQQAKEIKKTTNLKVGLYIGDRDVDNWGRRKWEEEIIENQILVGTAQIFVDIITQNYIRVTDLSIVIIDECHHATGNHPMHAFLSSFQYCDQQKLPRIIGLTGVLIKGNKLGNILEDLRKLEATFRGNIITIRSTEQMKNVMVYSTKPTEQMITFIKPEHHFQVVDKVRVLVDECKAVIDNWNIGTIATKLSKSLGVTREPSKKNVLKNFLTDFLYQMNEFGIYTASIAIMSPIIEFEIKKRQAETLALRNLYRFVITYCERIRHILVNELKSLIDTEDEQDVDSWNTLDIILNYSTPKLRSLFSFVTEKFKNKNPSDIACLLFVERRYTAKCLYHVLLHYISQVPELRNVIRPQFMVGRQNIITSIECILDTKWNKTAIDEFRTGQCNLIICSNVLEEGIDVQACNYVFVFDQLKTFNSYIQTKGRARSQNSLYAIFTPESDKNETLLRIRKYREIHEKIKEFLMTRVLDREDPNEEEIAKQFVELIPPFVIPSGARLLATSALALLHRYCQHLPWDCFGASQPWYTKLPMVKNKVAVSVKLPLQSTVKETIISDYYPTAKEAKISCAFKAYIRLYENGELNDFLLPITRNECIAKVADNLFPHWKKYDDDVTKKTAGKQLKRTYERQCPDELHNSLPRLGEKAYAYSIGFTTDFEMNPYNEHIVTFLKSKSTYALLVNKKLPKLADMPMFMSQGKLHVKISDEPIECVIQTQEQLNLLKQYHTMIFKDILQLWKEFMVKDHRDLENSYLIVPLDSIPSIDWQLIKKFQQLQPSRPYTIAERQSAQYQPKDYLNKVVTKWYNDLECESFVVTRVRDDLTPMSPFDNNSFSSYAAFYANRYNMQIVDKKQFLLEVKALTQRRNFFNNASNKSAEKKKERNSIVLIPELCHNYQYPADLWLKALFLPTILHRVYYMLHAESLRKCINQYLGLDKYFQNYKPQPLTIDTSLKRVLDDDGNLLKEKLHSKRLLPSLPTKQHNDDFKVHSLDSQTNDITWKTHLEPIDLSRRLDKSFEVEVDYYSNFVRGIVADMDNLRLEEELEWSKTQFEMPKLQTVKPSNAANQLQKLSIKDATLQEKTGIDILKKSFEKDQSLKSAEQYEFLAAITTAGVNDVFDMERYELLGDAFLKFSISLYLANKYTNWHEGFLTIIKGRIVSNRNLLYCMLGTDICKKICGTPFKPNTAWVPPLSSLPENLLNVLKENLPAACILSPSDFYSLQLTQNEIDSGKCAPQKLEPFVQTCIKNQELASGNVDINPDNDMNIYIYKDVLRDKVVADTLEALLGVCVKNYGIHRTFRMLEFFGICKSDGDNPLTNLLDLKLSSAQFRTNITAQEVDGFLLNYEFLEKNLSYKFRDRAYLLQALTHPSFPTNRVTGCYQELEFIGDAILDMLVTCYIFERYQDMNPGKMTDLRMALVNNITLGCICVRHRFHLFLLYENSALSESIDTFAKFQENQNYRVTDQVRILMEETDDTINPYNDVLNDDSNDDDTDDADIDGIFNENEQADASTNWPQPKKTYNLATNVDVPKALGDIVEALIAAVYLDCRDLNTTWQVIYHLMENELNEFSNNVPIDAVRQLEEIKQANPKYSPPVVDNDVVMIKCIFNCLDKSYTSNGFGCNAKQAKKAAAKQALQILAKHSN